MSHPRRGTIRAVATLVILSAVGLAACSASTASVSTTPAGPVATSSAAIDTPPAQSSAGALGSAAPSEAALPSASEADAGATAVPTAVDPCTLVTPAEVSALSGSNAAPKASTMEGHARLCSYGKGGLGFNVIVAQSPDAATAKQQEPAFKAQLEQIAAEAGITNAKLTELPDFESGVDAAVISGSVTQAGQKLSAISFVALKGAVLVALSDVAIGGSIPTSEAMQTQGKATLARLP